MLIVQFEQNIRKGKNIKFIILPLLLQDCSAEEAGLVYEPSTNRCEYPEDFNCV